MKNIYCEKKKVIWNNKDYKLVKKYSKFNMKYGVYKSYVINVNKNNVNKNKSDKYKIVKKDKGEKLKMLLIVKCNK